VHSDDNGLVLPPPIAPSQIVIVPILTKPESRECVLKVANELKSKLEALSAFGGSLRVEVDTRDIGGGTKKWEWIKKGVPLQVEIGPRDIANGSLVWSARNAEMGAKNIMSQEEFVQKASGILVSIRDALYAKAESFMKQNTVEVSTTEALEKFFADAEKSGTPGFAVTPWEGFSGMVDTMREKYAVTVRCHPMEWQSGNKLMAIWGQSY